MTRRFSQILVLSLAFGALGGCVRASDKDKFTVTPVEDLSMACTIVDCECLSSGGLFSLSDTVPLEWTADGLARCPEGYRLKRLDRSRGRYYR